jgi:integrase
MPKKIGLTDAKIAAIGPSQDGQVEYRDNLVRGLRLRVGKSGIKTYILRKKYHGRWLNLTLGRHSLRFKLADARKKARDLLVDIEQGKDVAKKEGEKRKFSSGVGTVSELAEVYLANEVRGKKRSAAEIERSFNVYILPEIGNRLADTITRRDVSELNEKVAYGGKRHTPVQARNVHRYLSSFYSWALPRLDALPAHPCRDAWCPSPPAARDRVLTDRELAALWHAAFSEGYPFGNFVQMLILTGQRRGEVLGAQLSEFDIKGRTWTIPGTRAKNGNANIVPLSSQALEIVEHVIDQAGLDPNAHEHANRLLFASETTLENAVSGITRAWNRIRKQADKNIGFELSHYRIHDIRRTVATGLQRLRVPLVVSEAVLNHQSGSAKVGVAAVYHRHEFTEEKREALAMWGGELSKIAAKFPLSNGEQS